MDNVDIIIFDEEDITGTLIESYLKGLTFDCNLQKYSSFNPDLLIDDGILKIVIVNLNINDFDIFNKISEYSNNKKIKFIAASYDSSANIQVKAFRAGAKDFLLKPLIKNDFVNSLNSVYDKYIRTSTSEIQGKIYTAVSNKNGDGNTSFLVNTAKEIADVLTDNGYEVDKKQVILIEKHITKTMY